MLEVEVVVVECWKSLVKFGFSESRVKFCELELEDVL